MELQAPHRAAQVKNKSAAKIQITAEQILREATERQDKVKAPPAQKFADKEELDDYRLMKRKGYEEFLRSNRTHIPTWLKYAQFEENQFEYERARSVFERALQVEGRNQTLWLRYSEMEMKHKNINHARNILDRAVTLLPRMDMFWYKYTYMEEMLENIAGARAIFERWMLWEPPESVWMNFVKFEERYKEIDRARNIFQRFVNVHPQAKNWIKWSKFEEDRARIIYEQCSDTLGVHFLDQNIFVSFAKFEIRQKEIERARLIYKYALEKIPRDQAENLYNSYTQFEKQFGGRDGIEDVVINKRRAKYESDIAENSRNYDVWFDYARLEESVGDHVKIREVYERALAQVPPIMEKRFWRRYVYIWLFYAIWEESVANDYNRADQVYSQCLKLIPHKSFSFAKVWILYAKFNIRRMDLQKARKTLGASIGMCPKSKSFKGYIEIELSLREFDRARILYEKYLGWDASNCYAWIKYTELERMLGDTDRARCIFEIAVQQQVLDMPEVLWKGFIDFEISELEWQRARDLYERLLDRTEHVKVHSFNYSALDTRDIEDRMVKSRAVFSRAYNILKRQESKQERTMLLEAWRDLENEHGTESSLEEVQAKMPKVVKKRRQAADTNGGMVWEEYYDYIFPDDDADKPNFKLLAMAQQWKMAEAKGKGPDVDSSSDEDESEEEVAEED